MLYKYGKPTSDVWTFLFVDFDILGVFLFQESFECDANEE